VPSGIGDIHNYRNKRNNVNVPFASPAMAKREKVSLATLTPDQAMRALL
jgi:hypothetical protein